MTKTKKVYKNLFKKLKCLKKFECRLSNTSLDIFYTKKLFNEVYFYNHKCPESYFELVRHFYLD